MTTATSVATTVMTLPAEYRPSALKSGVAVLSSGANNTVVNRTVVDTDGTVKGDTAFVANSFVGVITYEV